ncbi:MAG TPA: STAS/SEC14 domain-containing protein [Acidimicrobiales bacterium]|nr:STAS/SEC14 domain-containing protein [Acidimicrobiales bacterium]
MLKRIDSPDTVVALEAVGKLVKDDYDNVLVPAIRQQIDGQGEIRVVFVFGDQFEGLTLSGTASDAKLFVDELVHRDLSKWKRCAVVTNLDWLRHSIAIFRWMMPGQIQVYELPDLDMAIRWAAA